jgi:hypothetical protein
MPDSRMTLVGRATGATGGWLVAGGSWPAGQPSPPTSLSNAPTVPVDRSEATMSKLARALVLGVTLAAMNIAGLTAVASAQSSDEPTSNQDARRPPTQGQVGESWHQRQVTAEQPNIASDARRPPTESQVGESWRHPTGAPVRSAEPSGPPGWLVASLSVLVVALVLSGGLALLAARRAGHRARVGHAPA